MTRVKFALPHCRTFAPRPAAARGAQPQSCAGHACYIFADTPPDNGRLPCLKGASFDGAGRPGKDHEKD